MNLSESICCVKTNIYRETMVTHYVLNLQAFIAVFLYCMLGVSIKIVSTKMLHVDLTFSK